MKTAIVTGGSRGIGKAISLKLASQGYHVVINYHSNTFEAEKTLQEIINQGWSAELLPFDVSNPKLIQEIVESWLEKNPEKIVEVLVNNAGIRHDNLMLMMKNEEWESVINTNLNSFFYLTKPLLKQMLIKRYGRIINIVSLSGVKGQAGQTNYSAAKAAVIGATKALALEIAKKKITVNAVAPGFIKTDMTKDFNEKDFVQYIPTARFGLPEEVAELVRFLASDKASYITGEVININGGLYT